MVKSQNDFKLRVLMLVSKLLVQHNFKLEMIVPGLALIDKSA